MRAGRPTEHFVFYKNVVWINEDGTVGCFSISKKTLKKEDEVIISRKDKKNKLSKLESQITDAEKKLNKTENMNLLSQAASLNQISRISQNNFDLAAETIQESSSDLIPNSFTDLNTDSFIDPFSNEMLESFSDINVNPLPNIITMNDISAEARAESNSQMKLYHDDTSFNGFSFSIEDDNSYYPQISNSDLKMDFIFESDVDLNNDNHPVLEDIL